jgi:hypothetical protein
MRNKSLGCEFRRSMDRTQTDTSPSSENSYVRRSALEIVGELHTILLRQHTPTRPIPLKDQPRILV